MRTWLIRIIYSFFLVLGLDLYARPERHERFWGRFSADKAHAFSRVAGAVLILISVLFVLGAEVFLP